MGNLRPHVARPHNCIRTLDHNLAISMKFVPKVHFFEYFDNFVTIPRDLKRVFCPVKQKIPKPRRRTAAGPAKRRMHNPHKTTAAPDSDSAGRGGKKRRRHAINPCATCHMGHDSIENTPSRTSPNRRPTPRTQHRGIPRTLRQNARPRTKIRHAPFRVRSPKYRAP